jgi:hypothetical protein
LEEALELSSDRIMNKFYSFFNLGAVWGEWSKPTPTALPHIKRRGAD